MYNIGIIGMGVGENHARAYLDHPDCNIKTICDFDKDKSDQIKLNYPQSEFTNSDLDIINDNSIDIVSVASFDNYHFDQVVKLINNNKHVMVEKPICLFDHELDGITESLKNNPNIVLSSNLVLRTNSRFKNFRNQLLSGDLGDVYYIEADYYWGRLNKLYGWRADMGYYSIILGAAIHMIDLAIWLVNERPISVYALGNKIGTDTSRFKFNSFSILSIEFESGLILKVTGNGSCVHPHFHGLKIFGTEKTIIHSLSNAFSLYSSSPDAELNMITDGYPEKEKRKEVIHSFIDHLSNKKTNISVSTKETIDLMSVCFAAEQSIIEGEKVSISYKTI